MGKIQKFSENEAKTNAKKTINKAVRTQVGRGTDTFPTLRGPVLLSGTYYSWTP